MSYTAEQLASVSRASSPCLLPNPGEVLYVSDESGAPELWRRFEDGERRQLTQRGEKVLAPCASPDGRFAYFVGDQNGDERYDLFRFGLEDGSLENLTESRCVSQGGHLLSADGRHLLYGADVDRPFRPQLFLLDLHTGSKRQLTSQALPVFRPVLSADGSMAAGVRTADLHSGEMVLISLKDGSQGIVEAPDGGGIMPLAFSPNAERALALTQSREGFKRLALVEVGSGTVRPIGPDRWDVDEAVWHPRQGILFTRNMSGRSALWRMADPDSQAHEVLPAKGRIDSLRISAEGGRLAFTREDSTQPSGVFLLRLRDSRREDSPMRQLVSSCNGIDPARLSAAEPFRIESYDGQPIEGLFYRPPNGQAPHPAVAVVHGGPAMQSVESFEPLIQAFTQAGIAVAAPNYRGSTGYGKAFETLNRKDWGGGDRRDVRTVLQRLSDQGLVDRSRLGITGVSYGGYLTLMALACDPDFYAAGVESCGMQDLAKDYESSKDRWGSWYESQMGTPQSDPELFAQRSPANLLERIRAPLLIFQGANDSNVPRGESDRLVESLRSLGRQVEYKVYADEGHVFAKRANRIDCMQKTVDFFKARLVEGGR